MVQYRKWLWIGLIAAVMAVACAPAPGPPPLPPSGPSGFETTPARATATPAPLVSPDAVFDWFLAQFGLVEVLGSVRTPAHFENGVWQRDYDGAALYLDPTAPQLVRLLPLGLWNHTYEPPSVPAVDPNCRYYVRGGHNVCYVLLEWYVQHGGPEVLGPPISEMQPEMVDGQQAMVQWFENVGLVYVMGAPQGQYVRLRRLVGPPGITPPPPPPPQRIMATSVSVESPILPLGAEQKFLVRVTEPVSGLPVPDATVQFRITSTFGSVEITAPLTDADGRSELRYRPLDLLAGEFVTYQVVFNRAGFAQAVFSDSFLTWYGVPTATPGP